MLIFSGFGEGDLSNDSDAAVLFKRMSSGSGSHEALGQVIAYVPTVAVCVFSPTFSSVSRRLQSPPLTSQVVCFGDSTAVAERGLLISHDRLGTACFSCQGVTRHTGYTLLQLGADIEEVRVSRDVQSNVRHDHCWWMSPDARSCSVRSG